ncbi:hypothetical protein [Kutzneria sp. 744]|uniref:hypothetical protein n=1 Tax=Kutzneria sp. (strain 744) TaxID=345341 RepID=UPI00069488AC|nr:hypothetical protein [Kutzneria sp. 744]
MNTYSANLTVLDDRPVSATDAGNPPAAFDDPDQHAGQAQTTGDRLIDVWPPTTASRRPRPTRWTTPAASPHTSTPPGSCTSGTPSAAPR